MGGRQPLGLFQAKERSITMAKLQWSSCPRSIFGRKSQILKGKRRKYKRYGREGEDGGTAG